MSLDRPIAGSWLAARRAADSDAREHAVPLVAALADHLVTRLAQRGGPVTLVDLGSGTGANPVWLAPRLQSALRALTPEAVPDQEWVLVDHDPDLLQGLDLGSGSPTATVLADHRRVVGSVDTLQEVLDTAAAVRVVTCSALLDLLTPTELSHLAAQVAAGADAALFSLSVTGEVAFTPALPDDVQLGAAFDRHQQRVTSHGSELAGPRGVGLLAAAFQRLGWRADRVGTPWRLGPEQTPMLERWLRERVAAAQEALDQPEDAQARDQLATWWGLRARQVQDGDLRVTVQHEDLLVLPPSSPVP